MTVLNCRTPAVRGSFATALLAALLASCSPGEVATTTTTRSGTTSTTPVTTTTSFPVSTSTTHTQGDTVTLLVPATTGMGEGWTETFFPYGETAQGLGTSPGGEGLMLGPEYGTQVADGSWWFLDAAKLRYAHFSSDGEYIGQTEVPAEFLSQGIYLQFQIPLALDDGTVVATGLRESSTEMLVFRDGTFTSTQVDRPVVWTMTDGTFLYGFAFDDGTALQFALEADAPEQVEWFTARDGSRYMVEMEGGTVTVDLPDAGVTKTLLLRFAEDPEVGVFGAIEVETTSDGALHVLFVGVPQSDESLQIGGIVTISPHGQVGQIEPIVNPFTPSDPGSPAHLGAHPSDGTIWFMVVGEDGVHVYSRGT